MNHKTEQQLVAELAELRHRVAELEMALQEKETRASLLLQAAPLGIHECDTDGRITFVNPSQEAITGYTADELLGKSIWDRMTPGPEKDSMPAYLKHLVAVQPPPTPLIFKNIRKNGEPFDIRIDWNYKRDPRGQVAGFVCIMSDITAQQRAEAELTKSRAILQATIESLPFDFFAMGLDGRYTAQNAASKMHWGNHVGNRPEDAAENEQNCSAWMRNNRRAFAGEKVEEEIELHLRGEKRLYYNVTSPIIVDGDIQGILGINIDITERKQTEEALRKAHDELEQRVEERTAELARANKDLVLFRKLAEASGQGFGIASLNGQIVYLNPAMCRLGKQKPEDVVGNHLSMYLSEAYMHKRAEEIVPQILREGHWQGEIVIARQGRSFSFLQGSFLVRDEQGNPAYVATVITDISERKRAEEALRQSRDELQMIYDEMVEGCLITDIETKRFVRVNASMCQMLGYSEEELLAESVKDIHPSEEVANDLQRFQAVAENQRSINENRPVLRKDGSIFYADITGRRIVYDERPCVLALFRDVTEQRQAQAALRQSHDELRAIYDQAMDGIIIVDTEKIHPIRVNPAFCRMMGYSAEEAYTLSPERVHSPDVVPAVLEHLETAKRGHVARIDNLPFLLRDGSIVYADVISSPICYDEQPCVISFFHDVTTRTRSDEALRQSYEELRAIYDSMYEGLVILDSATKRIVRVNASLCQMLGYTEEELLSMSITEIYPADEVAATLARLQSRAKGSTEEYGNISILRKDGSVFYADILGNRLSYGGRLCVLGLFRDITEKKQAEVALAESEAKYRTLVETSPDAVIMTDLTGRITFFASQQLAELYGSESVHELLGQHALDYIVPEDHEKFHFHLKRTLEEGVWRNVELTFFRKDGTRYPGEASGALVRDASGKPTALIFVLRDITERKRAEETLQKEHRTLRHLLQSSDHERQLIAYEIHDDLAQQLAAAIMQFQAYAHLKDTNPNDAGKAYDAGMTLLRQGHFEARRLISGVRPPILDESGVVTAIAHLVNEESRVSGPTIAFRSEVEFDRLDPILENAIYRIVQAGLTNACKHSKSERVNVELVQQGDDLRITVQDWGIGFNPREVAEDRFGLEGIRERARLLGGNTVVESTPGQGCCITVALPLVLKE